MFFFCFFGYGTIDIKTLHNQQNRRDTDRLVAINIHNPTNYTFPGSISVNYGHQLFRVHQRAGGGGGGEGEPTSFCLDIEFEGGYKERVGRGEVGVRSGVDGTIFLERECRWREGGGKSGLVVLASIPPYNESVTKYIGSLTGVCCLENGNDVCCWWFLTFPFL